MLPALRSSSMKILLIDAAQEDVSQNKLNTNKITINSSISIHFAPIVSNTTAVNANRFITKRKVPQTKWKRIRSFDVEQRACTEHDLLSHGLRKNTETGIHFSIHTFGTKNNWPRNALREGGIHVLSQIEIEGNFRRWQGKVCWR